MSIAFCSPASRIRYLWISARSLMSYTGSAPTWVNTSASGAWEFADAAQQSVDWNQQLPNDMNLSVAPNIVLAWSSPATSKVCKWQVDLLYRQSGESTAAVSESSVAFPEPTSSSTANGLVITSFAMTVPNASDLILFLLISRMGAHANDTLSNTAHLHGMYFSYTSKTI